MSNGTFIENIIGPIIFPIIGLSIIKYSFRIISHQTL